ncbi:MAG: YqgE/AlgH family protein [Bacteroidetes bacterium]|nr:YqgE/AlgH family protein [Bacteroidota bacterium]
MNIKPGTFLKSSVLLNDSEFEDTLIFIAEFNAKGAIGFVINKPFSRSLNELEEFRHSLPFPLHDGGPVDREHLFCLHCRPDLIPGGVDIDKGIYWGGDFKQAIFHINNNTITTKEIKIFIGYCGWDYAQLEEEIEEGSWEIIEKSRGIVFE